MRRRAGSGGPRTRLSRISRGLDCRRRERTSEPYIYHFPDGNASLARLLVRSLIPEIAPGHTMDDVVLAPFAYGELDSDTRRVRIRLELDLPRRAQCRRQGAGRLCACGHAASGGGEARGARLLSLRDPLHHAGAAGIAARRARHEHQDADRLQQRAHTQLARLAAAGRARYLGADVVPQPRQTRLSRKHRRLSSCARSGRADVLASGSRTGRAQPGARCAHAVPYRAGEAARNDVRGFRGENSR